MPGEKKSVRADFRAGRVQGEKKSVLADFRAGRVLWEKKSVRGTWVEMIPGPAGQYAGEGNGTGRNYSGRCVPREDLDTFELKGYYSS